MNMPYGFFSDEAAQYIYDKVVRDTPPVHDEEVLWQPPEQFLYVKMEETLIPPDGDEDPLTGYKTAKANPVGYDLTGGFTNKDRIVTELEEDEQIEVTNRNLDGFIAKGDYIWIHRVEGEYFPVTPIRREVEAVMINNLAQANDPLTDPAKQDAYILHPEDPTTDSLTVTSWKIEVINRGVNIEIEGGSYIRAIRLNHKWHLSYADCSDSTIDTANPSDTPLGEPATGYE